MRSNPLVNPALPDAAERRAEERYAASGAITLTFDDPVHRVLQGDLLDYSKSGFRATHDHRALHTGDVVEFQHPFARGTARVIWNRILDVHVESGFLVLQVRQ